MLELHALVANDLWDYLPLSCCIWPSWTAALPAALHQRQASLCLHAVSAVLVAFPQLQIMTSKLSKLTLPCVRLSRSHWQGIALVQVLLLLLPGSTKASQVDEAGLSSLAVLRLMGLPALQVVVQGEAGTGASLKERSAAKKRAHAAVASQVPAHMSIQSYTHTHTHTHWQGVAWASAKTGDERGADMHASPLGLSCGCACAFAMP